MAEKIQAYKPVCCNKAFLYKSSAERHENRCPHNPQKRACQTCLHKIVLSETVYNPHHNGNPGSTDYDASYWFCDVYEKEISKYEDDGKNQPKNELRKMGGGITMDVKEKLVELLGDKLIFGRGILCAIASHLIDNNVTVQEWLPASEPPKDDLPVLVTCGKGYRPFVARYDLRWKRWRVSHTLKITHWQPLPSTRNLPQPPKGE